MEPQPAKDSTMRVCGSCQEAHIPRGVDWPYWRNGQPFDPKCDAKSQKAQAHGNTSLERFMDALYKWYNSTRDCPSGMTEWEYRRKQARTLLDVAKECFTTKTADTTFETPWRDLLATRLGETYHLLMPEVEGYDETICGLVRAVMDPVMSLPLARNSACADCIQIVNERLIA